MKVGSYESNITLKDICDYYHFGERKTVSATGYIVQVTDSETGVWDIIVYLPLQNDLNGDAMLIRPPTLRNPISQIIRKAMTINPTDDIPGLYVSELRESYVDSTGRFKMKQLLYEDGCNQAFLDASQDVVRYSEYRDSSRQNNACGWLFKTDEIEKMGICYYLSRIKPVV